jgi:orotidine-5'-phosphate decarboxylase
MNKEKLFSLMKQRRSFLCVGLDTDIDKLPKHLLDTDDPQFEFNKAIFDATIDYTPVYKINIAFYEALGTKGWISLERTVKYIRSTEKDVFLIADAKRGDIGNTSSQYARAFFDVEMSGLDFDAVTVAPYMGVDSVSPFLQYENKWVVLLALTSNKGADDFQMLSTPHEDGSCFVFEKVLSTSSQWGSPDNMMYVVGATRAEMLKTVRKYVPKHFLLIPGVGAQGGSLEEVVANGLHENIGLIVNASRSIIFASGGEDFAEKAQEEAKKMQSEMEKYLSLAKII